MLGTKGWGLGSNDEDDDNPELTGEKGEHWDVLGGVWVGWGGRGATIGSSRTQEGELGEAGTGKVGQVGTTRGARGSQGGGCKGYGGSWQGFAVRLGGRKGFGGQEVKPNQQPVVCKAVCNLSVCVQIAQLLCPTCCWQLCLC